MLFNHINRYSMTWSFYIKGIFSTGVLGRTKGVWYACHAQAQITLHWSYARAQAAMSRGNHTLYSLSTESTQASKTLTTIPIRNLAKSLHFRPPKVVRLFTMLI